MDFETALEKLPDGAREIFVLHDVEGYKHHEIATLLEISAGHVEGAAAPRADDAAEASRLSAQDSTACRRMTTFNDRLSEYLDDELDAARARGGRGAPRRVRRRAAPTSTSCAPSSRAPGRCRTPRPQQNLWPAVARADRRRAAGAPPDVRAAPLRVHAAAAGRGGPCADGAVGRHGLAGAARRTERTDFPAGARRGAGRRPAGELRRRARTTRRSRIWSRRWRRGAAGSIPQTVRVLERTCEAIDRAIEQCREALAADPANVYLNSHLAEARQRKLALLRRATAAQSMADRHRQAADGLPVLQIGRTEELLDRCR